MSKKTQKWSEEEIKILEECYMNLEPIENIMGKLKNRSYGAISAKAIKLGLTKKYIKTNNANYKCEYNDYDWCYDRFITQGMKVEEIAEKTNYKKRTLEKWIYEKHHLNYKMDFKLNDLQKMVVIAGCLGDGYISDRLSYIEVHAENQKDYIYWKFRILKNMCEMKEPSYYPPKDKVFKSGIYHTQAQYRVATREIMDLKNIKDMSRMEKIGYLNELGFALHFLDDASYNGFNWIVCLAEWTDEEKNSYLNKLKEMLSISGKLLKDDRYAIFDKNSSDIMNEIILRELPNNLDIIKYKITERVNT